MQTREVFESQVTGVPLNGNLDSNTGTCGIAREIDAVSGTQYVLVYAGSTLIARFLWEGLPTREC